MLISEDDRMLWPTSLDFRASREKCGVRTPRGLFFGI